MARLILYVCALLVGIASAASAQRADDTRRLNAILANDRCFNGPCDLTAGTTIGGVPISGGGETNTASNLGGGLANYSTKVGADLRFNSFAAADFDLASNLLTIDGTKWLTIAAGAAAYQPLDADLTSIAALTTTAGGRNLLSLTPADDAVIVGDSASASTPRVLPSCSNATTSKLLYDTATNAFSCGTDQTGGGGGNSVEVSLAITSNGSFFSTAVTGQTWVSAGSEIVCTPFGTTEDGLTPEAVTIGGLDFTVSDKAAGAGFTLNVYSPNGLEGTVRAHCIGV